MSGVESCPVTSASGGFFTFAPFAIEPYTYGCRAFAGIERVTSAFRPFTSGCSNMGAYYAAYTFAPASAPPVDVFITRIELEYRGISFSVYDASGAKAVARFPSLRVAYTSLEERATAP